MDILRKMFNMTEDLSDKDKNQQGPTTKDEFRKPQWCEETETDDELFDDDRKFVVQVFTSPLELQKHFDKQMQMILEGLHELDEDVKIDKDLKSQFLEPGFESNIINEKDKFIDTDLDGEILADELHSLMQRLRPEKPTEANPSVLPSNGKSDRFRHAYKKKLSDHEIIFGRIHGTLNEDNEPRPRLQRPRSEAPTSLTPMMPRSAAPFGGVFEGGYNGPKMYSQSIMSKTIRKPDGTFETTKTTQDSHGNKTTTVTRSTQDGKSETITVYDGAAGAGSIKQHSDLAKIDVQAYSDRNIAVTKEGYAVPRNLW